MLNIERLVYVWYGWAELKVGYENGVEQEGGVLKMSTK